MSDEEREAPPLPPRGAAVSHLGWPVGAVSERIGVAASTLRSWDRRHGVGPTSRTDGRHRRYSEADIRRVLLMARLTAHGLPAQSAADTLAAMDDDAVSRRLGSESGPSAPPRGDDRDEHPVRRGTVEPVAEGDVATSSAVESIVGAAAVLDGAALSVLYRQNLRQHDIGRAWSLVFVPALGRIGELWARGDIGIESEHLASELLQSELRGITRSHRSRLIGPPVMLANADDELHYLPLLALEAGLATHAVASLFLGPRLPTESLIDALVRTRPRTLFLWASLTRRSPEPLWEALRAVDWPLSLVVGGPGWPENVEQYAPAWPKRGGTRLTGLSRVDDFPSALRALIAANQSPSS